MKILFDLSYSGHPEFDDSLLRLAMRSKNVIEAILKEKGLGEYNNLNEALIIEIDADRFNVSHIGNNKPLQLLVGELNRAMEKFGIWDKIIDEIASSSSN